jgi:hypothetical protein
VREGTWDDPVKPKGYRKPNSRLRVSRSPVYLPTSRETQVEAAQWLKTRKGKEVKP